MKKLIIILLLQGNLVLFSQFSVGIEAGVGYSWITTKNEQYKKTNVPVFGTDFCANFEIPVSKNFFFRSGIGYSAKGSEQPILTKEYSTYFLFYSRKIKLHYIQIPLKATYIFNPNKTSFFTSLGMFGNFGISGNVKEEGTEFHAGSFLYKETPYNMDYNIQWNRNNQNQIDFNKFNFGGLFEIGLHSKYFEVSCQYEYGLPQSLLLSDSYRGSNNILKLNIKTWFHITTIRKFSFRRRLRML